MPFNIGTVGEHWGGLLVILGEAGQKAFHFFMCY